MSLNKENPKILATMILEVLGRPPEHLTETLKDLIKKMGEEEGVSVKEQKINEPHLIKDQKEFYTTFAEIEVETQEISQVIAIMFKYMPSHIEIISPEKINLSNNLWNETLNEITRKLHAYDELARVIQNEKIILENKLKEFMEKKR